ncbi:MAG: DUF1987 domain-containing protein [Cyclobacteriaceae bacterium]
MKGYFVRPTRVTPSIYFNPDRGIIDIRGRSCPENPLVFYKILLCSLDQLITQSCNKIKINLAFEYFNTSSLKCLFICLGKLDKLSKKGKYISINWFYEFEDMDMIETGEDMNSFFSIPFNFIGIDEIKILGEEKATKTGHAA